MEQKGRKTAADIILHELFAKQGDSEEEYSEEEFKIAGGIVKPMEQVGPLQLCIQRVRDPLHKGQTLRYFSGLNSTLSEHAWQYISLLQLEQLTEGASSKQILHS